MSYRSNMCDGRDHWLAGRLSPRWLDGLVIWEMSVYHVDAGRVGRQHAMRCHEVEGMFLIPDGRCTVRFRGGEMTGLAPGIRHFLNPPNGLQLEPRNTSDVDCQVRNLIPPSPPHQSLYHDTEKWRRQRRCRRQRPSDAASQPADVQPAGDAGREYRLLAGDPDRGRTTRRHGPSPGYWTSARKPVPARIKPDTVFTQVAAGRCKPSNAGQAMVLGVPAYDAAHCAGPTHAGVFVVRRDAPFRSVADLRGCHFVFNSIHSNSGMNLPRRVIAELAGSRPFFGSIVRRIASRSTSNASPRRGRCHVRGLRHLCLLRPLSAQGDGAASYPGRDTAHARDPVHHRHRDRSGDKDALARALRRVATEPEWAPARAAMLLLDVVPPDQVDYQTPCRFADEAAALGYPRLH